MTKTVLLSLLADGEFHSGQDLAGALGVSRTAVWKQLHSLEAMGLALESVKGRGYRIPGGVDLLQVAAIRAALDPPAASLLGELAVHEVLDSTNAEVLRQLDAGARSGYLCTAEQQTAGRGRRGRQWVSPFARNIYLSIAWEYAEGAAILEGLSLAVGAAVAQALARLGVEGITLKWPNDLLHGRAKLGGVLIEMAGDTAGACHVVVGVGLNVAMPAAQAAAIDQSWTDLARVAPGLACSRSRLVAALANELLPLLDRWPAGRFADWRAAWEALDAFAGRPVVVHIGERQLAGTARGVDQRGALLLETSLGIQPVFGGEISLRSAG
jgi:BirA family biotin operon repressor/biotin-[acetyl-CoA-carboxylase] ligase